MEESRQQCFLFADFGISGTILSAFSMIAGAKAAGPEQNLLRRNLLRPGRSLRPRRC
jgi:hypothetical protein